MSMRIFPFTILTLRQFEIFQTSIIAQSFKEKNELKWFSRLKN